MLTHYGMSYLRYRFPVISTKGQFSKLIFHEHHDNSLAFFIYTMAGKASHTLRPWGLLFRVWNQEARAQAGATGGYNLPSKVYPM